MFSLLDTFSDPSCGVFVMVLGDVHAQSPRIASQGMWPKLVIQKHPSTLLGSDHLLTPILVVYESSSCSGILIGKWKNMEKRQNRDAGFATFCQSGVEASPWPLHAGLSMP